VCASLCVHLRTHVCVCVYLCIFIHICVHTDSNTQQMHYQHKASLVVVVEQTHVHPLPLGHLAGDFDQTASSPGVQLAGSWPQQGGDSPMG
jgi:hypothetical protein